MKKFIPTLLALFILLIAGNVQASADSIQHKGRNHRDHNSHDKKNGHWKGIHFFHRHGGHHGKDDSHKATHSHSHHGRNHSAKEKSSTK